MWQLKHKNLWIANDDRRKKSQNRVIKRRQRQATSANKVIKGDYRIIGWENSSAVTYYEDEREIESSGAETKWCSC